MREVATDINQARDFLKTPPGGAGEHPDWDDYRAAMVREQRVLVRIKIERAGPDQHG